MQVRRQLPDAMVAVKSIIPIVQLLVLLALHRSGWGSRAMVVILIAMATEWAASSARPMLVI